MQQHLQSIDVTKPAEDESGISLILREMLCVAAKKLSEQMRQPLEKLGVLYEDIIHTGHTSQAKSRHLSSGYNTNKYDPEKSYPLKVSSGKGQTLFVYKQVGKDEAARLQSHSYRFANIKVTLDVISRSLHLPRDELFEHLANMTDGSSSESILEPGVHIGFFAIRANINGGFDTVVQQLQPNLIPSVQLPLQSISEEMKPILQSLNNLTLSTVLQTLNIKLSYAADHEHVFIAQMHASIRALTKAYPDEFFREAVFSSTSINMPCRAVSVEVEYSTATMYLFRCVIPLHQREFSESLRTTPFEFFSMQQRVFSTSRDREVFARRVHAEFSGGGSSSMADRIPRRPNNVLLLAPSSPGLRLLDHWGGSSLISSRPTTAEKNLVETGNDGSNNPFASILVSQAIDVQSMKTSMDLHELDPMRVNAAATAVKEVEEPTWAEVNFQILMGKGKGI